jgi:Ankyrin repeats (many copies)
MSKVKISQEELDGHLCAACLEGHGNYAKVAIAAGANVNSKDSRGNTPLHCAATISERRPLLRMLLDNGADPTAKNSDGKTPLDVVPQSRQSLRAMLRTAAAKTQQGHAGRIDEERKDRGPPQVEGIIIKPQELVEGMVITPQQEGHTARVTGERKDKGPPQVGG